MISDEELQAYLQRIELSPPSSTPPDLAYLNQLHHHHVTHIPFETFDLIDRKELIISHDYVFDRLVRQHRGGVCYQMNGLFASILKKLNYQVRLIPCNVFSAQYKTFTVDFSHAASLVTLPSGEKYHCDVGFSRDALTPLHFQLDVVQYAYSGFFRFTRTEDGLFYQLERGVLKEEDPQLDLPNHPPFQTQIVSIDPERIHWLTSYRFSINFQDADVQIEDFQSTCAHILHSPTVILNHCSICRMQTIEPEIGAYGIVGKKFYRWRIVRGIEHREDRPIENNDDLKKILREIFGLVIDREIELVGSF